MSRQGQSITLSVSERDKGKLEALALEFGLTWGEKPNISKLLKAIACRQLLLAPNHDWPPERIQALESARKTLIDAGKIPQAMEIAELLKERGETTIPLRQVLEDFLHHPQPSWRQKIDSLIHRQQPFRLSYRDAADRQWDYTILHARIISLEKRDYLVCRTQESEGNRDIEALRHNWTLRLDRIQEAAIAPLDQSWMSDLATIPVEFHLFGGLAFAYEPKPDDEWTGEIEGNPPSRRVVRNIWSTFWFFREIAAYWDECAIISPQEVRQRFQNKVRSLSQLYS